MPLLLPALRAAASWLTKSLRIISGHSPGEPWFISFLVFGEFCLLFSEVKSTYLFLSWSSRLELRGRPFVDDIAKTVAVVLPSAAEGDEDLVECLRALKDILTCEERLIDADVLNECVMRIDGYIEVSFILVRFPVQESNK